MELTQRTSAVMKVSERHFDRLDPLINVFRTFGKLNEVLVTAKLAIVPDDSFADSVQLEALKMKAEMVIVPWASNLFRVVDYLLFLMMSLLNEYWIKWKVMFL